MAGFQPKQGALGCKNITVKLDGTWESYDSTEMQPLFQGPEYFAP